MNTTTKKFQLIWSSNRWMKQRILVKCIVGKCSNIKIYKTFPKKSCHLTMTWIFFWIIHDLKKMSFNLSKLVDLTVILQIEDNLTIIFIVKCKPHQELRFFIEPFQTDKNWYFNKYRVFIWICTYTWLCWLWLFVHQRN